MEKRLGLLGWTSLLLWSWILPAAAQEQHLKVGGGAGFSFPSDPLLELERGYDLGGFFGIRFNDNFSLETGFSFQRSERQFTADNLPVQDPSTQLPAFLSESTRYHLDGILLYNIGRRQPFHPFIFGGAGILREDKRTTDLTPLIGAEDPAAVELETTTESEYYPVVSFGIGFDFYILYNVAARGEWRWWMTEATDRRTHRLFFAATYFF